MMSFENGFPLFGIMLQSMFSKKLIDFFDI
jgi:hypothetical protein